MRYLRQYRRPYRNNFPVPYILASGQNAAASGIIHEKTINIIGNGTVIELDALFKEINELKEKGVKFDGRFYISDRAHVIMPYHIFFDKHKEELKGANKIGTTGRGIGPTYMDKTARNGIRIGDI